jgi:glutathione S-transferase
MKLYWSSRSPFVRKVMVVAHETGLAERIDRERTVVAPAKPNPEVMALNPLNKLPTLVTDEGAVLYDSRVICEFLDALHSGPKLFPADPAARIEALRMQALGDGTLDFLLLWLSERARPAEQQSADLLAALRVKFTTAFDALERQVPGLAQQPFSIAHAAIGCVCGYADFRYAADEWRNGRPQLASWYKDIAARPSFKATEHVDAY